VKKKRKASAAACTKVKGGVGRGRKYTFEADEEALSPRRGGGRRPPV